MESLLLVRGLKTEFSTSRGVVRAVDGVDLEIRKGEVLGLVGESGCGKSVTALSIMYLVPQPPGRIASGEIWFRGIDLLAGMEGEVAVKELRDGRIRLLGRERLVRRHRARMNKVRGRDMSMIFQEPMSSLNPVLPVGYQVAEVLMYQRRQEICDGLLSEKALTGDDLELFQKIITTEDPTERDHLVADLCLKTALPAERISALVETSGLTMEERLERLQALGRRRRKGSRWFVKLLKDLDLLETEHTNREWRALSKTTLAKIAAADFDASRNPETKGLPRLTRVTYTEDSIRLSFGAPPTEEHRALAERFIQDAVKGPRGPVYALVGRVTKGPDYLDLVLKTESTTRLAHEANLRSRSISYRLLMLIPVLRTWLMRPLEEEARRHVLELLKLVRIPEPTKIYYEYPHELSGGMQQRIMIAMALACDPALMIADEPTTALDVTTQAQILKLIRDLRERVDSAILYITHDLAVIAELSDRVAVMYAGKIVEDATVDELFAQPLHPYTQGLLASIVSMDSHKVEVGAPLPTIPGTVPDLTDPPKGCRFHPRCKYAFARCSVEDPALLGRGTSHKVACHLYDKGESSGTRS